MISRFQAGGPCCCGDQVPAEESSCATTIKVTVTQPCSNSSDGQQPSVGVAVSVQDGGGQEVASGVTDANGEFLAELPGGGTYTVIVPGNLSGSSSGVCDATTQEVSVAECEAAETTISYCCFTYCVEFFDLHTGSIVSQECYESTTGLPDSVSYPDDASYYPRTIPLSCFDCSCDGSTTTIRVGLVPKSIYILKCQTDLNAACDCDPDECDGEAFPDGYIRRTLYVDLTGPDPTMRGGMASATLTPSNDPWDDGAGAFNWYTNCPLIFEGVADSRGYFYEVVERCTQPFGGNPNFGCQGQWVEEQRNEVDYDRMEVRLVIQDFRNFNDQMYLEFQNIVPSGLQPEGEFIENNTLYRRRYEQAVFLVESCDFPGVFNQYGYETGAVHRICSFGQNCAGTPPTTNIIPDHSCITAAPDCNGKVRHTGPCVPLPGSGFPRVYYCGTVFGDCIQRGCCTTICRGQTYSGTMWCGEYQGMEGTFSLYD